MPAKSRLKPMSPENIREARIKNGLSQTELAEKVGAYQGRVSAWECGKIQPNDKESRRLAEIFGDNSANGATDASPIAAWLTKARMAAGLSVGELASRAGLSYPGIYNIERGITRSLRDSTRKKIEAALSSNIPNETRQEVAQESQILGLGNFEDFDPHDDDERPHEPGIYMLYDISERPIYVGEGGNVRRRIKDHEEKFWFKRPIVESASWIRIEDTKLRQQIEQLLIKFLKSNAVINKQHVERSS
jgi:transcriptional regulator with XRE-family HTH domain